MVVSDGICLQNPSYIFGLAANSWQHVEMEASRFLGKRTWVRAEVRKEVNHVGAGFQAAFFEPL